MRPIGVVFAVLLIVLGLSCGSALAAEPNGCGAGWSLRFVPDNIRLLSCTFKAACDGHDQCYDKCSDSTAGKCEYRRCKLGGDLYMSSDCAESEHFKLLESDAQSRRAVCDSKLHDDIVARNSGWICRAIAVVYREAVKEWGDPNFSGFGTMAHPAAWRQSQKDYEKAIQNFLTSADEAEIQKFVESFESGRPRVNFCGRLQFRDGRLQNISANDRKACGVEAKP